MKFIKGYKDFEKINELTEFNLQRMNPDSAAQTIGGVDDRQLSTNAFDKFSDGIRQAMSRINDILHNLSGSKAYSDLRKALLLEDQDITSLKIIRIYKSNNINYNVYVFFNIGEKEYWGVIENINTSSPEFRSEVFKDISLYQAKEWVIKTKGLIINTIKKWLKPDPGMYRLINDNIKCYSKDIGKRLIMNQGIEIELVRSHDDKIIVKYENDYYNLINDNYIYFNWWFEKID
jgi:hypothetical protein